MALKIAFSNQKGGCGKTTCTNLVAGALSQDPFNYKVVVCDIDPQESLALARENDVAEKIIEPPYQVVQYEDLTHFDKDIAQHDEENDIVLLDSAGKLDARLPPELQEITRVLNNIDILFVPIPPGAYNMDATITYFNFVRDYNDKLRQKGRSGFDIFGFMNMSDSRRIANRELKNDIAEIERMTGIRFLRTQLRRYTLFESTNTLTSIYDVNSSDVARLNFTIWLNELHKMMTHE